VAGRLLTTLPVYNEASHVADVLGRVLPFCSDVLVVNDGSTDNTAAELARYPNLRVITHEKNRGYGGALASAFEYAIRHDFDLLVTIDCDGQHEPQRIPELVAAVTDEVDIVSGSRYLASFFGDSAPPEERRYINAEITRMLNHAFGWRMTDSFCGFKAYRVSSLSKLQVTEFGYAMPMQFWVQVAAHNLRVVEHAVPLIYLDEKRSFGGALDDAQFRLKHYRDVFCRELRVYPDLEEAVRLRMSGIDSATRAALCS
jgi:dolichol-phosphate mannosyltransferase